MEYSDCNNVLQISKKTEIKIESVCRTCLTSSSLLRPLFPDANKTDVSVTALYLCTGLQIKLNDGFPQNICSECSNSIKTSIKFRKKSQESEKALRQYLNDVKKILVNENNQSNEDDIILMSCALSENCDIKAEHDILTLVEEGIESTESNENNKIFVSNLSCRCDFKSENGSIETVVEDSIRHDLFKQATPSPERDSSDDEIDNSKVIDTKSVKLKLNALSYDRKRYLELAEGPIVSKKPIKCKICQRLSKCLNSFEKHAMSHLGYNFLCEFCAKACISSANLLRHQRRKHGLARDNSFYCNICGFQAIDKEQLEVHERRVHTKERPFVCDDCGAAFFSKRVLIQHQANHKTEKPFQCNLCSSKFKLRCRLTKHIHRVHTKNYCKYTYGCYICMKKYSRTPHVRKHILKIHGIPMKQQDKVLRFEIQGCRTVSPDISSRCKQ